MTAFKDLPINGKLMRMNLIISASLLLFSCGAFVVYQLMVFRSTALEHLSTEADIVAAGVYRPDGLKFAAYERDRQSPASLPPTLKLTSNDHRLDAKGLVVL